MTTRHQRQAAAAAELEAAPAQPERPPRTSQRADMAAHELIAAGRIIRLPGWRLYAQVQDGQRWINDHRRLSLIWSIEEHDGGLWLHVSIASPDRMPRWDELVAAKEWIAGTDAYAYQVIPPRRYYVNEHERALHVYSPLEGATTLPEFSGGTGRI